VAPACFELCKSSGSAGCSTTPPACNEALRPHWSPFHFPAFFAGFFVGRLLLGFPVGRLLLGFFFVGFLFVGRFCKRKLAIVS